MNKKMSEGKLKANEIRNNLSNLETTSTRLANQYQKALSELNETHQFYISMLDERRAEISRELEQVKNKCKTAAGIHGGWCNGHTDGEMVREAKNLLGQNGGRGQLI